MDETQIVDKIFRSVLEQRLLPGTKLSETDLCALFDVGRMRVRRALLILSSRGIVEHHPHKGAFIARYTPDEAVEIFKARVLLETMIIKEVCAHMTAEQFDVLSAHIDEEAQSRREDDISAHVRLSGLFHVRVTQLLGNNVLTEMMRDLVTRTSLIVARYGAPHHKSCKEEEHRQLLEAMAAGQVEKAQKLMEEHLDHIQQSLTFAQMRPAHNALSQMLS